MIDEPFKYFAFISYSHRDSRWADWLHRRLETYRVPAHLLDRDATSDGGELPKRIFPIFRDRVELPTSYELSEQIITALDQSRFLVVICSPRAAVSRWVNEEILSFKRLGRSHRILCLIVDGEPNASDKPGALTEECFPEALRFQIDDDGTLSDRRTEPIAADARPRADSKGDALLKVVAGLLGVGFDDLKRRELRRRHRRLVLITTLALALALLTGSLAVSAVIARREAERQGAIAVQTLAQSEFMQGIRLIESDRAADGMAHLARAIRVDPGNRDAADALLANLLYRTWPMPVGDAQLWSEGEALVATVSADGNVIATAGGPSGGGQVGIKIYNRASKQLISENLEPGRFVSLRMHPSRDLLVASGVGMQFRIFRPSTGEPVSEWISASGLIAAFDSGLSSDGEWFVVAGGPSGTFVWPVAAELEEPWHLDRAFDTVMFSGDDETVVLADAETIHVHAFADGEIGEQLSRPFGVASPVGKVSLLGDDAAEAIIATWRGDLAVWDVEAGESFGEPVRFPGGVNDMALSADQEVVLVASETQMRVLNATSLRALSESAPLHHSAQVTRFVGDSRIGVALSSDDSGRLVTQEWDFRSAELKPEVISLPDRIDSAMITERGDRIAVRTTNRTAAIFSISADGELAELAKFGGDNLKARLAVISADGLRALVVNQTNAVTLNHWVGEEIQSQSAAVRGTLCSAAVSDGGPSAFLGYTDGRGDFIDVHSGMPTTEAISFGELPQIACLSASGSLLAVATSDKQVQLWSLAGDDPSEPQRVAQIGLKRHINSLAFDRHEKLLLCATGTIGEPGEIHFLDTASGKPTVGSISVPAGVFAVALNGNADRVAAASYDGTVRVWLMSTGVPLTPPLRGGSPTLALRFAENDTVLLAATSAGEFQRWSLPLFTDQTKSAPAWLAEFAETVSGRFLDDRGIYTTPATEDFSLLRNRVPRLETSIPNHGILSGWCRWILDDRETRPPSPQP